MARLSPEVTPPHGCCMHRQVLAQSRKKLVNFWKTGLVLQYSTRKQRKPKRQPTNLQPTPTPEGRFKSVECINSCDPFLSSQNSQMVARRKRTQQNKLSNEDRNEEPSTKLIDKSVESDDSRPGGESPTEANAVNVSVMVMGSDEEGFSGDESEENSMELNESAPDDAGYTADAEDGDVKGDDADDADDEVKDSLEEDGLDIEVPAPDEDDRDERPPSPADTPDSATENDATAGEHDFESEGNENVEPSENVNSEPGDDGNEQMSNEGEERDETDVADGENSEVENHAATEGSAGYATAQGGHAAFDEGEMSNGNSDTRDAEVWSDKSSSDGAVEEPPEAGSENGIEMANGHVPNGHENYVDAPSPLEAGDNEEITDATEERRSEGEAPSARHREPIEPAEANGDDSDVENGVIMDDVEDDFADEHSEIEDEGGDPIEGPKSPADIFDSGLGSDDRHIAPQSGRNTVEDVSGSDLGSEGGSAPSHREGSAGDEDEDEMNVKVETHAAADDSGDPERGDANEDFAEDEGGTEESEDDINTRSYKLVPETPASSLPPQPQPTDAGKETNTTEPTKRKRGKADKTSSQGGVIYIPRIPPGLDVTALRSLLSRVTQMKRVWLRPETNEQRRRRQSLGGSRRKQRFRDGWVEVSSRKEAKRVVGLLNGQPMLSGKRRGRWADDLWCLKYLKGFAWTDLTNEVFGGRERVLRVRERVMEGRRMKEWVEGRGKGQGIKVRQFRQKRGIEDLDDVRAKQAAENVDREMDGGRAGASVDDELVGMLFKKRRT